MKVPIFTGFLTRALISGKNESVLVISHNEAVTFLCHLQDQYREYKELRRRELKEVPKVNDDVFYVHNFTTGEVMLRKITCGSRSIIMMDRKSAVNLINEFTRRRNMFVRQTYGENAYLKTMFIDHSMYKNSSTIEDLCRQLCRR